MSKISICLHTGLEPVMKKQMDLLSPLNDVLDIEWNNRFYRHPGAYNSWSALTNDAIITSKNEYIIIINDRTIPQPHELLKILTLLYSGFAAATIYSVGFVGFTKELFRNVGFFDERFTGGGWEDDDFVLRLHLANLAYYESREGTYDFSWKSHLRPAEGKECSISAPAFSKKWIINGNEIKRINLEDNKNYIQNLGQNRPDIKQNWKTWDKSILKVTCAGASMTRHFMNQPVDPNNFTYYRKVTSI